MTMVRASRRRSGVCTKRRAAGLARCPRLSNGTHRYRRSTSCSTKPQWRHASRMLPVRELAALQARFGAALDAPLSEAVALVIFLGAPVQVKCCFTSYHGITMSNAAYVTVEFY